MNQSAPRSSRNHRSPVSARAFFISSLARVFFLLTSEIVMRQSPSSAVCQTYAADNDALEREVRIYEKLMRMSTPHVLQVLDFIRDDEQVALVTEYADGGDLQAHVEAEVMAVGSPFKKQKTTPSV